VTGQCSAKMLLDASYASVNVFNLHLDFEHSQPPRSTQLNHEFNCSTSSTSIIIGPYINYTVTCILIRFLPRNIKSRCAHQAS
jgi:hypothetical protein